MKRTTNVNAGAKELESIAAVVLTCDEEFGREVRSCAEACGARILSDGSGATQRAEVALALSPDIVFLEPDDNLASLEAGIAFVKARCPRSAVIVVQKTAASEAIVEAFRAGADEYVFQPDAAKVRAALTRVLSRHAAAQRNGNRVIGVLAAKGGCGATTLAWHLAGALQSACSAKTLLCDLDLGSGVLGFLTKVSSGFTVQDALNNMHRLDASYWSGLVSKCAGFDVLAAPPLGPFMLPGSSQLRGLVSFMRTAYAWSVLDLGCGVNPFTLDLLKELDEVILVYGSDPLSAAAREAVLGAVRQAGVDETGIRVVMNATPEPIGDARRHRTGMTAVNWATLPFAGDLEDAYIEGRPLDSRSKFGAQVAHLARDLAGIKREPAPKRNSLQAACDQLGRRLAVPLRRMLGDTADQCAS